MKLKKANEVLTEAKKESFRDTIQKKYGITEFDTGNVGFSPSKKKWYGWSHRAITGFGVGDKKFEANFKGKTDTTPFSQHGTQDCKTLDDAKEAARRFAKYVS